MYTVMSAADNNRIFCDKIREVYNGGSRQVVAARDTNDFIHTVPVFTQVLGLFSGSLSVMSPSWLMINMDRDSSRPIAVAFTLNREPKVAHPSNLSRPKLNSSSNILRRQSCIATYTSDDSEYYIGPTRAYTNYCQLTLF